MKRNVFALALAGGVATLLFCSDVTAFRSDSVTDDIIQNQCIQTSAQSSDVKLGLLFRRPGAVASGTSVSAPPVLASSPAYPTLTVPQLYQPSFRPGLPVLHYPAGATPSPPSVGAPQLMRPVLHRPIQHPEAPSFGSLRLADARGQLVEPPRYMVVALDTHGRPAGVPLFQQKHNGVTYGYPCSGFLGAAAPPEVHAGGVGPPIGKPLDVASQVDSRGWQIADRIDLGTTVSSMGFTAHAVYQVEQAARTGHDVAGTIKSVDAGIVPAIGQWAQDQHLLPATKNHTSILAGVSHGGAHITTGLGVAFSGLSLAVSARSMYVSHQAIGRAEDRREEIWEVSHEMSDQEYDAAMAQLDAVVQHQGRNFALSASGATLAGIGGTLGVMVLAGTTPVWAPPVGLSVAVAGAGLGIISVGRMWLDPEPDMPDVAVASLLEVPHNVDVNTSTYLSYGGTGTSIRPREARETREAADEKPSLEPDKPLSAAEEDPVKLTAEAKIDYVKNIVAPTWSRIFAKKHNLVPFYIDMLWRELQKKFGMQMKYILIQDPHKAIHRPESSSGETSFRWDDKEFDREFLINLLQEFDHPDNKLWWVSDTANADMFEDEPALKTRFWGRAPDTGTHPSSATLPTADDIDHESDDVFLCFLKGPSPDAYCQAQFGPDYICHFSFDGNGVLRWPLSSVCEEEEKTSQESLATRVDAFGVTADLLPKDGEPGVILRLRITDLKSFTRYWTSLHGFSDKDWEQLKSD